MEDTEFSPLGESLMQWVKTFDNLGQIEGWNDLSDGKALWKILQEVDLTYFSGALPEPDVGATGEWTRKWQNIKQIDRQLSTYYRDVCNGQDNMAPHLLPDLKAIAEDASGRDLERLIMILIRAAMASPESNQRMAHRLMSLGRERAMIIANELRNMEEVEYAESDPLSRDESAYQSEHETRDESPANGMKAGMGPYRDPLLEKEEELLQAQATIDKLQASQATAQQQLQQLRQDKEMLQEAFDAYRQEIETKGRKPATSDDAFKRLQRQAENDRAYIEDLENQMQSSRSTLESYELQLERYKADAEAGQKLRDDLQMLKAENEDLRHKVKANENLKKKIQALQEQEKLNSSLREDLKQANERLEELDKLKHIQAGLEKEIIEKKGLIRNQEYQINELTTTRKHAEYDARVLAQKLEAARERHDRDHEALEELRAKLQEANIEEREPEIDETTEHRQKELVNEGQERKVEVPKPDESKHLIEKVALLEKQLEAADARLKQAAQRNASLEEHNQNNLADVSAREAAERLVAQHERTIAELRQQVENASKESRKETPTQDIAILQRENHLMATAWYDLSSRLQNNGVSLGRRKHEPRSWIGKQRALVGPNSNLQQS